MIKFGAEKSSSTERREDSIDEKKQALESELGEGPRLLRERENGRQNERGEQEIRKGIYSRLERLLLPRRDQLSEAIADREKLPTRQDVYDAFPFEEDSMFVYDNDEMHMAWVEFANQKERPFYEVITHEFVDGFSKILMEEVTRIAEKKSGPVKILEVGAGNGKLMHHLEPILSELGIEVELMAVDIGDWEDKGVQLGDNVTRMDYRDALAEFQPNVVFELWMPPGQDFSKDFREAPSVESYVLVGTPYDTGTPETWGTPKEIIDAAQKGPGSERVKRIAALVRHYEMDEDDCEIDVDGFRMTHAPREFRDLQISRMRNITGGGEPTDTLIFRRDE